MLLQSITQTKAQCWITSMGHCNCLGMTNKATLWTYPKYCNALVSVHQYCAGPARPHCTPVVALQCSGWCKQAFNVRKSILCYIDNHSDFRKRREPYILFPVVPKMAQWIHRDIRFTNAYANKPCPLCITANPTRTLSTSWAEKDGASANQICKAGIWSNLNTYL